MMGGKEMNPNNTKNNMLIICFLFLVLMVTICFLTQNVHAGSYDGSDLAYAILTNQSVLVDSSYNDNDNSGTRQATVLSSLGIMQPTDGTTFALLSTGIAGSNPVTTNAENPGDERGTWFRNKHGAPRDSATLTMTLLVPDGMHYLYYDVQFFTTEFPEFIGPQYNDKLTVTVNSPSKGISEYVLDVNSGYFVLDSDDLTGTGFEIYAGSGNPVDVDWVQTTPRTPGADAGATDLVTIGGLTHPVSPAEIVEISITIIDGGDSMFDSAAFIDNMMFAGYAKTNMIARKTVSDLNGNGFESNDTIKYSITLSNTGNADQMDNPGNEFEDTLPENISYAPNSLTATSGSISFLENLNKIIWNGSVPAESSVLITFEVTIDQGVLSNTCISNQGTLRWDSNGDGENDRTEYTDDPFSDDGIDDDGDGYTGDDDPTVFYVSTFEPPAFVTEDFSDDYNNNKASQLYQYKKWFETTELNSKGTGCFSVVSQYYHLNENAFKIQLRNDSGPLYWHYYFSNLYSDISSWEISFKCGNASESSDLSMTFKNELNQTIAGIKFDYTHDGSKPQDWLLELDYLSGMRNRWIHFNTFTEGYLYNGWYRLKIERFGDNNIKYYLYKNDNQLIDYKVETTIDAPFSNLNYIEFTNSKNPIVCPMYFFDNQKIGLINEN